MRFILLLALVALVQSKDLQDAIREEIDAIAPMPKADAELSNRATACILGQVDDKHDKCIEIIQNYTKLLWEVYAHNWAVKQVPRMVAKGIRQGKRALNEAVVSNAEEPMMAVPVRSE